MKIGLLHSVANYDIAIEVIQFIFKLDGFVIELCDNRFILIID